ncbi:hypothetical protein ACJX0J_028555, partial [Zea mays]
MSFAFRGIHILLSFNQKISIFIHEKYDLFLKIRIIYRKISNFLRYKKMTVEKKITSGKGEE